MSKKDKYSFSSKGFSMPDELTNSSSIVASSTLEGTQSANITPPIAAISKPVTPPTPKKSNTTSNKLAANPPSQKTEVKKQPVMPTNVDKLQNLVSKYEASLNDKKETITDWINICNYLNRTNDPKVFQGFYVWFSKHLKDYTSPEIALSGVHTIQNANVKTRVSSTHQCFEELARVLASSKKAHFRFTVKSMQAMAISESLARWLLSKGVR